MAMHKRYTSAAYEDKYFPEKNAAVPFIWESTPGRTKHDNEENGDHTHSLNVHADKAKDSSVTEHHVNKELSVPNIKTDKKEDELIGSTNSNKDVDSSSTETDTPHAVSIYPLPPPPKLSPASPLRVKDLLQHASTHGSWLHDDDDPLFAHDDDCPLHAYHHWLPWFSFRFWPFKATSIVPIHNNTYCVIKPQPPLTDQCLQKFCTSPFVPGAALQGRSHSFSHVHRDGGDGRRMSASSGRALKPVPERRCNSFNSLSAPHHTIFEHDEEYDNQSSVATAAAAAMWAGACILAAAAADNHHHHVNDPCKVARKLRDLMEQSANFSELGLPAPCRSTPPPTKNRTKSVEEEVFLKQGTQKSCTNSKCCTQARELSKEKTDLSADGFDLQPSPHKLVKRKGYFTLFKNECIGCWCPSSNY
ncbi:hypothetical protein L7F22_001574 [Adiantum nelumboides]|nr:hypothetical protein [Adiantum nelumboides]